MTPRRILWLTLGVAALVGLAIRLATRDAPAPATPPPATPPATVTPGQPPEARQRPLPGEPLLEGYASDSQAPLQDLHQVHDVIDGYFSIAKDESRFPIGGNADLAAALRGDNSAGTAFVPPDHPVLDAGLLVDRWGTPYHVHPEAFGELEIRSAGPDRTLFTTDDLLLGPHGADPAPTTE